MYIPECFDTLGAVSLLDRLLPPPRAPGTLTFRCNICATVRDAEVDRLSREVVSCSCGSTVRMRAVIHVLSVELFGKSLPIAEFPLRKDIAGIGMSDWEGYAHRLARKLAYQNTYFHKEPRLDITAIDDRPPHSLDFIISSDVFEHVPPPVGRAFDSAHLLLKPGGLFVFTVPYRNEPGLKTLEHFPELHAFKIVAENGKRQLENTTRDGRRQVFKDLVFHGGEGETLEMRVFAEESLCEELRRSGFKDVKIHRDANFAHGIYWSEGWSLPITARA
jgi:SAM-dependent methyltransferase